MEMETRIAERFESRTDPTGAPWVPLRPKTLARKKGRGSTLIFTGEMLDSLSHRVGDGFVEIGFGKSYAAFHEFGAPNASLPARRMLAANIQTGELGAEDHRAVMDSRSSGCRRSPRGSVLLRQAGQFCIGGDTINKTSRKVA